MVKPTAADTGEPRPAAGTGPRARTDITDREHTARPVAGRIMRPPPGAGRRRPATEVGLPRAQRTHELRKLWHHSLRHTLCHRLIWRGCRTNNGHWAAAGGNGGYAYGNHYSGTAAYGGAYHPPAVVNQYYGTGCYNCAGWSGGAVAAAGVAGVAVGAAVGAAAAANANAAAALPTRGDIYAALPGGCVYASYYGRAYYNCTGTGSIPPMAPTAFTTAWCRRRETKTLAESRKFSTRAKSIRR